jgi:hypothetical protein
VAFAESPLLVLGAVLEPQEASRAALVAMAARTGEWRGLRGDVVKRPMFVDDSLVPVVISARADAPLREGMA